MDNKKKILIGVGVLSIALGVYFFIKRKKGATTSDAEIDTKTYSTTDSKNDASIVAQRIAQLKKLIVKPSYIFDGTDCSDLSKLTPINKDKCITRKEFTDNNNKYQTELDVLNAVLTKYGFKEIDGKAIKLS